MAGLLTDEEWIDRMYGPNADTPTSEIYRLLGLNPNLRRGTILPIATNEQGGIEAAVPNILIDLARAVRLPFRAISGKSYGFEDVANLALNFGALGSVATKPAGALASGAARASKPSALPMDEASRMARAREMGANLDEVWHHGTPVDLYKTKEGGFRGGDERVTFASSSPFVAEGYTRGEISLSPDATGKYPLAKSNYPDMKDGGVYSLRSLAKNVREIDAHGEPWFNLKMDQDIAAARAAGHDAVIYRNIDDNMYTKGMKSDVIVWLDPTKIRATGAAFDPAKKDSADLLAGVIGLPGGSFLTGLNQERSKRGISKIAK